MNDLISKSRLKNELSKIPSEMGLIKKAQVIQAIDNQKTQDGRQTNADCIRNMTDEELAMFVGNLAKCTSCDLQCSESSTTIDECCRKHLEWLQSEAE